MAILYPTRRFPSSAIISESVQHPINPSSPSPLIHSSLPSIPIPALQWPVLRQLPAQPNPTSTSMSAPSPALDLSRQPGILTTWAVTPEEGAQEFAGHLGLASNSGPLASNLSGIQVGVGDPAKMLPTEEDFEKSLSKLKEAKSRVQFYAEEVRMRNALA